MPVAGLNLRKSESRAMEGIVRVKTVTASVLVLGAGFAWLISLPTKSDAG